MKRKEDEKISGGPMFPRLHVNDTDKGGPRAPPRNKMALYEQLSIPSQRFNRGVLPINPNSSSNSNMVTPASSGPGNGLERNISFPRRLPSSTNTRMDEDSRARQSNDSNLNAPLVHLEQGDKVGEEDDFQVPVFVHSGRDQGQRKTQNGSDRETQRQFRPSYSVCSTKLQNTFRTDVQRISSQDQNLGQVKSQSRENPNECMLSMDYSMKSTRRKLNEPSKEASSSLHMQHERSSMPQSEDTGHGDIEELSRYVQKGHIHRPSNYSHSAGADCSEPDDGEYHGDQTCGSQPGTNADKSDEVSETSMVDSMSGMDISPDDVVGIIGQKRFWKARRAIVNQQRVFAVQVFELHRLIKVQKLIASSPHLLYEDGAYLTKPSLKGSPVKKLPDYVVRPSSFIMKRKDDAEKANSKIECSAENTVGKTSAPIKNGTQPPSYGPYVGNPPPTPVATDKMGPWCFPQAPGHQWLVPVMTPSEGLVYKPYPGPGFMGGAGCGGCGTFAPIPFTGNLMNPGYSFPISHQHHHQGTTVLPGAPHISHSYFPPIAMPVMNTTAISGSSVDQMNQPAGPVPVSHGQVGQILGGGSNLQHQSSCNVPTQKSGPVPQSRKVQASKRSELQGSTASSPRERNQGNGTNQTADQRDGVRHTPMALAVPEAVPQVHENIEQPSRAIRVVPHNPRSATESAARIFQSIQKERKQYDSI